MKANILRMKNDIKELVKIQKETKAQRKTVKFTGERTMDPGSASIQARNNRATLCIYYQAYAKLRGKDADVHIPKKDPDSIYWANTTVNELLEKYKSEEAVCDIAA